MTFIDYNAAGNNNDNDQKPSNSTNPNKSTTDAENQWGYDLYPERRKTSNTASISEYLKGKGKENIDKIKCERNVYKCIKESPLVKLMMGALKASGCAIDIRRHISCEECAPAVSGGYDPILNQVSVNCQIRLFTNKSSLVFR